MNYSRLFMIGGLVNKPGVKPTLKLPAFVVLLLLLCARVSGANNKYYKVEHGDTIFAGSPLANAAFIKDARSRFSLLIYANNSYKSIKFLYREVRIKDKRLQVVQKLYNGAYTNTDSVIVDRKTLLPVESHSDINTSIEDFVYSSGKIGGTIVPKEGDKKGVLTKVDTAFLNPMFNGLIYAETYQALTYQKNRPFYLAEYVPGHSTKFTKVEYIRDDEITISGTKITAKVLEMTTGQLTFYCWLDAKDQALLKIEGKFPKFDYYMLRMV